MECLNLSIWEGHSFKRATVIHWQGHTSHCSPCVLLKTMITFLLCGLMLTAECGCGWCPQHLWDFLDTTGIHLLWQCGMQELDLLLYPMLCASAAFGSLICYFTSVWDIEWLLNQHAFLPLFPFPLLGSNIFCIFWSISFFSFMICFLHPKVLRYSPYGVVTYYQTYLPLLFSGIEFIFLNTQWLITHGVLFFALGFCFNIL